MAKTSAPQEVMYAVIVSNVEIAVSKLVATTLTGSSAMLAEGFHSIVDTLDTGNESPLLPGVKRTCVSLIQKSGETSIAIPALENTKGDAANAPSKKITIQLHLRNGRLLELGK